MTHRLTLTALAFALIAGTALADIRVQRRDGNSPWQTIASLSEASGDPIFINDFFTIASSGFDPSFGIFFRIYADDPATEDIGPINLRVNSATDVAGTESA